MFRIESYITSIILSYVEKYVKNLRRQDAQVHFIKLLIIINSKNCIVFKKEYTFASGIAMGWRRLISKPGIGLGCFGKRIKFAICCVKWSY